MADTDKVLMQAIKCMEAADSVIDLERKLVMLELAKRWLDLAAQMDATGDRSELGDALLGVTDAKRTRH